MSAPNEDKEKRDARRALPAVRAATLFFLGVLVAVLARNLHWVEHPETESIGTLAGIVFIAGLFWSFIQHTIDKP